jgi:PH domain/Ankyrin repeats (3 copies)/Ankyrin repeat
MVPADRLAALVLPSLCPSAESPLLRTATRSGWLQKRSGGARSSWKRRFVVLNQDFLLYYHSQEVGAEPALALWLGNRQSVVHCTEVDSSDCTRHPFQVHVRVTPSSRRRHQLLLATETLHERYVWLEDIRECAHHRFWRASFQRAEDARLRARLTLAANHPGGAPSPTASATLSARQCSSPTAASPPGPSPSSSSADSGSPTAVAAHRSTALAPAQVRSSAETTGTHRSGQRKQSDASSSGDAMPLPWEHTSRDHLHLNEALQDSMFWSWLEGSPPIIHRSAPARDQPPAAALDDLSSPLPSPAGERARAHSVAPHAGVQHKIDTDLAEAIPVAPVHCQPSAHHRASASTHPHSPSPPLRAHDIVGSAVGACGGVPPTSTFASTNGDLPAVVLAADPRPVSPVRRAESVLVSPSRSENELASFMGVLSCKPPLIWSGSDQSDDASDGESPRSGAAELCDAKRTSRGAASRPAGTPSRPNAVATASLLSPSGGQASIAAGHLSMLNSASSPQSRRRGSLVGPPSSGGGGGGGGDCGVPAAGESLEAARQCVSVGDHVALACLLGVPVPPSEESSTASAAAAVSSSGSSATTAAPTRAPPATAAASATATSSSSARRVRRGATAALAAGDHEHRGDGEAGERVKQEATGEVEAVHGEAHAEERSGRPRLRTASIVLEREQSKLVLRHGVREASTAVAADDDRNDRRDAPSPASSVSVANLPRLIANEAPLPPFEQRSTLSGAHQPGTTARSPAASVPPCRPELASAVDSQGRSLLHLAAEQGSAQVVRVLLSPGGGGERWANQRDARGLTPLLLALYFGNVQAAHALAADPHVDLSVVARGDGSTPLYLASRLGKASLIALLIARGADVNASTRMGSCPLHGWLCMRV